jgi:hypothetical protein
MFWSTEHNCIIVTLKGTTIDNYEEIMLDAAIQVRYSFSFTFFKERIFMDLSKFLLSNSALMPGPSFSGHVIRVSMSLCSQARVGLLMIPEILTVPFWRHCMNEPRKFKLIEIQVNPLTYGLLGIR